MATQHEAGLVVCVTGPESTGKTTLAEALGVTLDVPVVAEVAREWLTRHTGLWERSPDRDSLRGDRDRLRAGRDREIAPTTKGNAYTRQDVLAIARAQLEAEQAALATGAPVVVADTDLTVIQVWWEERYGALDPWLARELERRSRRCYLLMLPDIPWQPDPLRESPLDRERLFRRYREILSASAFPFVEVSGSGATRHERAVAHVLTWLGR